MEEVEQGSSRSTLQQLIVMNLHGDHDHDHDNGKLQQLIVINLHGDVEYDQYDISHSHHTQVHIIIILV